MVLLVEHPLKIFGHEIGLVLGSIVLVNIDEDAHEDRVDAQVEDVEEELVDDKGRYDDQDDWNDVEIKIGREIDDSIDWNALGEEVEG